MSQDEDVASEFLDREEAGEVQEDDEPSIPLTRWTPERESLARVEELLQQVVAAIVASSGGKPSPLRPATRPRTAATRLREARRVQRNHDLMALLIAPGEGGNN